MKTCDECLNFCSEGPQPDQPWPEFWCAKGKWDGVSNTDDLYEEIECEDFSPIKGGTPDAKE
jgi:hypothetical protein